MKIVGTKTNVNYSPKDTMYVLYTQVYTKNAINACISKVFNASNIGNINIRSIRIFGKYVASTIGLLLVLLVFEKAVLKCMHYKAKMAIFLNNRTFKTAIQLISQVFPLCLLVNIFRLLSYSNEITFILPIKMTTENRDYLFHKRRKIVICTYSFMIYEIVSSPNRF